MILDFEADIDYDFPSPFRNAPKKYKQRKIRSDNKSKKYVYVIKPKRVVTVKKQKTKVKERKTRDRTLNKTYDYEKYRSDYVQNNPFRWIKPRHCDVCNCDIKFISGWKPHLSTAKHIKNSNVQ